MARYPQLVFYFVVLSVYCLAIEQRREEQLPMIKMFLQHHSGISRFRSKRENHGLYHKNYVRAVQPNVVVMPSVPNSAYGGVPSYGVNRPPTVVVSMPNDVYNTPVVANPYAVPTRY